MNFSNRHVLILTLLSLLACGAATIGRTSGSPLAGGSPSPGNSTQALPTASYCYSLLDRLPVSAQEKASKNPASRYALYATHSTHLDPLFLEYVHAIAFSESHFDPKVKSKKDAYGLMQMTQVAMVDAAAYCHIPVLRNMDKLYDPATNIKYGTCYLKFLLDQTDEDYVKALILYNGGYRALTLYEKGSNLPNETAQYVLAVDRVRKQCSPSGTGSAK